MTAPRETYLQLVDLCAQGLSDDEIAEAMGLNPRGVRRYKGMARELGYLPPKARVYNSGYYYVENLHLRQGGPLIGNMKSLIGPMDKRMLHWLIDQTSEGATVADTIRLLVTDVYLDEQHQEETTHEKPNQYRPANNPLAGRAAPRT